MRRLHFGFAVVFSTAAVCGSTYAGEAFIKLKSGLNLSQISRNGEYATGFLYEGSSAYRWTVATGAEELMPGFDSYAVNNAGTLAGALSVFDPSNPLLFNSTAAYALIGSEAILLASPWPDYSDSVAFSIADEGTWVGQASTNDVTQTPTQLPIVWRAATGMSVLPVEPPIQGSGTATSISADGSVIGGAIDGAGVIWQNGVPTRLTAPDGSPLGSVIHLSSNGQFAIAARSGLWSAISGFLALPGMEIPTVVSDDGKTVIGLGDESNGYAPAIWQEGVGTVTLVDYLAERGIVVPSGIDIVSAQLGAMSAMSGDGKLIGGTFFDDSEEGFSGYLIRLDSVGEVIFADGFDDGAG